MRHCCASYADKIRDGESYLYRVLAPERATLEIRRRRPVILELRLAKNQSPAPRTRAAVDRWLRSSRR